MTAPALDGEHLLADSIAGKFPDAHGRFGPFGGRYVPETLIPALERLEEGIREKLHAGDFQTEYQQQLKTWVGRPTALTYAARLSERWGAKVWLKREDLAHTGAHKINNAIGQAHRRGDWCRAAWSRERGCVRPPRPALYGLHGSGRHGAPGAQCWKDAA